MPAEIFYFFISELSSQGAGWMQRFWRQSRRSWSRRSRSTDNLVLGFLKDTIFLARDLCQVKPSRKWNYRYHDRKWNLRDRKWNCHSLFFQDRKWIVTPFFFGTDQLTRTHNDVNYYSGVYVRFKGRFKNNHPSPPQRFLYLRETQ